MSKPRPGQYDGHARPKPKRLKDASGREVPVNPTFDLPMRRFFENADQANLEGACLEKGGKFETFLRALTDVDRRNKSMMTIAREEGLTLHELQGVYTDYCRHMMLLEMSAQAPGIGRDVAKNALNKSVVCPRCDGLKRDVVLERNDEGKVVSRTERDCPVCHGVGEVEEAGDKHAIDKVFGALGLEQKAPLVNINQQFGANDPLLDPRMETLLKLSQEITMGKPEPTR